MEKKNGRAYLVVAFYKKKLLWKKGLNLFIIKVCEIYNMSLLQNKLPYLRTTYCTTGEEHSLLVVNNGPIQSRKSRCIKCEKSLTLVDENLYFICLKLQPSLVNFFSFQILISAPFTCEHYCPSFVYNLTIHMRTFLLFIYEKPYIS